MKLELLKDCREGKAGETVEVADKVRVSVLINVKAAKSAEPHAPEDPERRQRIEEESMYLDRAIEKQEEGD